MEISREPAIDGTEVTRALTLKEYSLRHQLTEDRVWEMIEEGELSARFVNDTILIYRESEEVTDTSPRLDIDFEAPSYLMTELLGTPNSQPKAMPVPHLDLRPDSTGTGPAEADSSTPERVPESQSDLLLFAQDSIARTVELSHQLLATKDELLRLKDEKLAFLERSLQDKDLEIRSLKRELENMQILNKFSKDPHLLRTLHKEDE